MVVEMVEVEMLVRLEQVVAVVVLDGRRPAGS